MPLEIPGVSLFRPSPHRDERGYFVRLLESDQAPGFTEWSLSYNDQRGTLRGLHYQRSPHAQAKLIFVTRGCLFDVVVDLRPGSLSYGKWQAFELSAHEPQILHIPAGCAHGFQTLEPSTALLYAMNAPYVPDAATGIRWDDPCLAIPWPLPPSIMSVSDAELPLMA